MASSTSKASVNIVVAVTDEYFLLVPSSKVKVEIKNPEEWQKYQEYVKIEFV